MNFKSLINLAALVALLMALTMQSFAQVPVEAPVVETLKQTAQRLAADPTALEDFLKTAYPLLNEKQKSEFIQGLTYSALLKAADLVIASYAEIENAEHVGKIKGMVELAWREPNTGSLLYLITEIYPRLSEVDQKLLLRELAKFALDKNGQPRSKPGVDIQLLPFGKIAEEDTVEGQLPADGPATLVEPETPSPAPRCERTAFDVNEAIVPGVALTSAVAVQAETGWDGFAEVEATLKPGAQFGQINLSAAKGHFWVWAQADTQYQQVYAGPRFNLKRVEVGVGAGAESVGSHWRLGAYDFYARKRLTQLNLWETGASGFWFRNETSISLNPHFSIGAFGQRYAGWGARLAIKFRHSELWIAALGQRPGPTALIGLRRNF